MCPPHTLLFPPSCPPPALTTGCSAGGCSAPGRTAGGRGGRGRRSGGRSPPRPCTAPGRTRSRWRSRPGSAPPQQRPRSRSWRGRRTRSPSTAAHGRTATLRGTGAQIGHIPTHPNTSQHIPVHPNTSHCIRPTTSHCVPPRPTMSHYIHPTKPPTDPHSQATQLWVQLRGSSTAPPSTPDHRGMEERVREWDSLGQMQLPLEVCCPGQGGHGGQGQA